jgi:hypothetical protein
MSEVACYFAKVDDKTVTPNAISLAINDVDNVFDGHFLLESGDGADRAHEMKMALQILQHHAVLT